MIDFKPRGFGLVVGFYRFLGEIAERLVGSLRVEDDHLLVGDFPDFRQAGKQVGIEHLTSRRFIHILIKSGFRG